MPAPTGAYLVVKLPLRLHLNLRGFRRIGLWQDNAQHSVLIVGGGFFLSNVAGKRDGPRETPVAPFDAMVVPLLVIFGLFLFSLAPDS